jgi:hypothetical protein
MSLETPNVGRKFSCGSVIFISLAVLLVLISITKILSGDQAGYIELIVILAIAFFIVLPIIGLARLFSRTRLGKTVRGEPEATEIIRTKQFSFFLQRDIRPWWVTALLYILGLLVILFFIIVYSLTNT